MASPEAVDGFVTYLAGIYGEHIREKYAGTFKVALREDFKPYQDEDLREACRLIRRELESVPPFASLAAKVLPFLDRTSEERKTRDRQREEELRRVLEKLNTLGRQLRPWTPEDDARLAEQESIATGGNLGGPMANLAKLSAQKMRDRRDMTHETRRELEAEQARLTKKAKSLGWDGRSLGE